MKKIRFMDTSFRDGFQSVFGARVLTKDFLPALEASKNAGIQHFEAGGGARFQSLFFYCNESAFEMMDTFRKTAGPHANLQTLARGINVVALSQAPRDIIELHAKLFKKHGITTIRNFDALNDIQNLEYSGKCIRDAGLHHQAVITIMDLPPGCEGAHTPEFYLKCLKDLLDSGTPFDSICLKDSTGTANPQKVYDTFRQIREQVGDEMLLWFHTHDTAGTSTACYLAGIEGAATRDDNFGIDLAKSPVSGGTSQPDILSLWHALKGKDWTLGIDVMKVLESENVFRECMKDYFFPLEAAQVTPEIPLSPMPGGALTANTMMMRDNGTFHLYPEVLREMSEVVKKGGFATSVTPVSQFYFQQAYSNVTAGRWKKITDGYGNMVLGYFGRTPTKPDPDIVRLAKEQLKKDIFEGNPLDILEPGIPKATETLKKHSLEVTDENIFIAYSCGDKGIEFLKGTLKENIRKITPETKEKTELPAPPPASEQKKGPESYVVTVNGQEFHVTVAEESGAVQSITPKEKVAPAVGSPISASLPGTVVRLNVKVGDSIAMGDILLVLEAMKMETPIKTPRAGKVTSVQVAVGTVVKNGDLLVTIQ